MKTFSKIILLILFVIIALGAVLIFVKTQLAPPGDIAFKDPYSAPLAAEVAKVSSNPFPQNKGDYMKAYHKVRFMNQEEVLTDKQTDNMITRLDTAYGNKVVAFAYKIFNGTEWPEENIKLVASTVKSLRDDKLLDGERAITPQMDSEFREIDLIITNYRKAWTFAKNTSFSGVPNAESRINSIDSYLNMPYISNNRALVKALNDLPSRIGNSHYNYVLGQINKLAGYRDVSYSYYYDVLAPQVNSAIEDYKKTNIYGNSKKSTDALYKKAQEYQLAASNYYDSQNYYY